MNVLFMCVANSARSQMAEAIARQILGENARVESAGSNPTQVNPLTVQALNEIGIDASKAKSKSCDDLSTHFLDNLDYVITLCAEEVCPVITAPNAKILKWGFMDPATGDISTFRSVRDQIRERIEAFAKEVARTPETADL